VRPQLDILFRCLCFLPMLAALATSASAADSPATIKRVLVSHHGAQVEVRILLSRPVTPQMMTATGPERVLLDFPDTSSSPHQHRVEVNKDGVKAVRFGLNQSSPPITRLVVDLERTGKYEITPAGNEIVLTVTPGPPAIASGAVDAKPAHKHVGPPAAANGPWIHLSGQQNTAAASATPATTPLPPPVESHTLPPSPPVSPAPQPVTPRQTVAQSFPSGVPAPAAGSQTNSGVPAQNAIAAQPAGIAGSNKGSSPASSNTPSPIAAVNPSSGSSVATAVKSQSNEQPAAAPAPSAMASSSAVAMNTPAVPEPISASPESPAKANADIRTVFRVKYVADGAVYLDGGRADGLAEGVALVIKNNSPLAPPKAQPAVSPSAGSTPAPDTAITAHLKVISVAQNSAVCEIGTSTQDVKPGDLAYLASADAEALVQQRALSSTRVYPQVITFTQGDPMDEEVRDEVPRPPLPEINRTRMRIGFDYGGISSRGASAMTSSQFGMVIRTDMTRIGGTYWNLRGYWRGRLNSQSSAGQPTLQDLLNRTYTIGLTYDNPQSHWVAGVGRLYLPWANSLDVIDGGYAGRRFGKSVTAGIFAGSTPDPTSWSYNPNQRIAGSFINFEGGAYDGFHYTSTSGVGVSTLLWQVNKPFIFFENGVSYKRFISVYESLQADKPKGTPAVPSPGAGISRSYVTVSVQPIERLSLTFNHNYFRDVPTYNLSLVGTGLLDQVLFQGFSVGARLETVKKIYIYTEQGRSTRSGGGGQGGAQCS